jgi:hypothetical protein
MSADSPTRAFLGFRSLDFLRLRCTTLAPACELCRSSDARWTDRAPCMRYSHKTTAEHGRENAGSAWNHSLHHVLSLSCHITYHLASMHLWSRSARIISLLKNTVSWFFMREKYCPGWKNKLNKTDYKPDEQGYVRRFSTLWADYILLHHNLLFIFWCNFYVQSI